MVWLAASGMWDVLGSRVCPCVSWELEAQPFFLGTDSYNWMQEIHGSSESVVFILQCRDKWKNKCCMIFISLISRLCTWDHSWKVFISVWNGLPKSHSCFLEVIWATWGPRALLVASPIHSKGHSPHCGWRWGSGEGVSPHSSCAVCDYLQQWDGAVCWRQYHFQLLQLFFLVHAIWNPTAVFE